MRRFLRFLLILAAICLAGGICILTYKKLVPYLMKLRGTENAEFSSALYPDLPFSDISAGDSSDAAVSASQNKNEKNKSKDDLQSQTPENAAEGLSGFDYDQMSDSRQNVYAQLFTGISSEKNVFYIYAENPDDIGPALSGLLADHPEFFWLDGQASIYGSNGSGIKKMTMTFNIDASEIASTRSRIEAAVQEFLSRLPEGAGEYEIVKSAYEYVILNTSYDNSLSCSQNQNIQSVFLLHESICAGYAKAFQYLLHRAGVYCAYIEGTIEGNSDDGTADSSGSISDGRNAHAWNLVRIDGTYTLVDPTWGDPTYSADTPDINAPSIFYGYLCITTEEMARLNHVPDAAYALPDCSSRQYDYYRMNGMYYETYDENTISSVLWDAIDNNVSEVHFKFGDFENYAKAMDSIYNKGLLSSVLQQRLTWDAKNSMSYLPHNSDALCTIDIYW